MSEKSDSPTTPLTKAERIALQDQIASAKARLAVDKQTRPKRQLTAKQLENLRRGREANPHFKPKNKEAAANT